MSTVELNDVWIGKMPSDWQRSRIRNVVTLSPSYSASVPAPDEPCTIVPMELLSGDGAIDVTNQETLDGVASGLNLFEAGDVLFAKITPCMENGKGAFVRELPTRYAFGSTEFHVLRPSKKVDGAFLYYATFNPVYRAYAAENMVGAAGQKRVSSRFVKDTRLFLPPLPEQRRIAEYLDASCAAIDAAVSAKLRQLETLYAINKAIITKAVTIGITTSVEQRSSGVEWIGEIPRHWKVEKLKYLTSLIVDGTHITPSYLPDGVPFLRVTDIQDQMIDLGNVKYISPDEHQLLSKRIRARRDDILLSKNGTIGVVKIVNWDWEFSFFVSICLLRPYKKLNPHYFSYFFESSLVDQQLSESSKKTSVTNLHLVKIRELLISLPPIDEQSKIVQYLQVKCAEVQSLKDNITNQIATLIAYRKSLIHECVTGQRRISEADMARR